MMIKYGYSASIILGSILPIAISEANSVIGLSYCQLWPKRVTTTDAGAPFLVCKLGVCSLE